MKKLYLDCTNGISSDMVLGALLELGADQGAVEEVAESLGLGAGDHHHDHDHGHSHNSYQHIREMIENSHLDERVKKTALSVYGVIAKGEAQVHETTLEDVHFHEVGRPQAIANIVGIAAALADLNIEAVYCSEVHDGKGFIDCSHGRIPVPVPAVMAMRQDCDYKFVTDEEVHTEMVTPSGLGILIGIGAVYTDHMPPGAEIKQVEVRGKRETGKGGLKAVLIQGE